MTLATMTASAGFDLALDPADALPLFTADGERRWVPGWLPQRLGGDGPGSVFLTQAAGAETVWIVVDYDEARGLARYARWIAGVQAGLVEVRCSPVMPGRCRVDVRYTLTPLSAGAVTAVTAFLEPARFAAAIADWKRLIVAAGIAAE